MAKKPDLTKADGITADVVVELSQFYSSNELRSVQSKFTGTARAIRELTGNRSLQGRIGEKLSLEQRQLLKDAAQLIDSVNDNITHAKERKKRAEDAKAAWRKQRQKEAQRLSEQAFPMPYETLDQKLEILRLAMALNMLSLHLSFMSKQEFHRDLRSGATPSAGPSLLRTLCQLRTTGTTSPSVGYWFGLLVGHAASLAQLNLITGQQFNLLFELIENARDNAGKPFPIARAEVKS